MLMEVYHFRPIYLMLVDLKQIVPVVLPVVEVGGCRGHYLVVGGLDCTDQGHDCMDHWQVGRMGHAKTKHKSHC